MPQQLSMLFEMIALDKASPVFAKLAGEAERAGAKAKAGLGQIEEAHGHLSKALLGGAVVAGVTAMSAAVVGFAKSSVDAFKETATNAVGLKRVMGGSIEDASRLGFAAKESGLSNDQFTGSIVKLEKNLVALHPTMKTVTERVKQNKDGMSVLSDTYSTNAAGLEIHTQKIRSVANGMQTLTTKTQEGNGAWKTTAESVSKASDVFVSLSKQIEVANPTISKMGIQVRDATGAIKPMADLLPDLAEKFKSMPDGAEKTALALKLFGKQGADMLPFLNRGKEGITDLMKESDKLGITMSGKDATALKAYNKAHKDVGAAMEGVKISLGRELMPVMATWMTAVAKHAPEINAFVREGITKLSEAFKTVGTILAKDVAPVLATVFRFISDNKSQVETTVKIFLGLGAAFIVVEKAVKAYNVVSKLASEMTKIWRDVQVAFNFVMEMNPIGLVILAIGALVVAIVIAYKNSATFREIVKEVWTTIKSAISDSWNYIRDNVFKPIGTFVTKTLPDAFTSFKNSVSAAWDGFKGSIGDAWNWVRGNVFNPLKDFVVKTIPSAFHDGVAAVGRAWTTIQDIVMAPWNWLQEHVFQPLHDFMFSTLPGVFSSGVAAIGRTWDSLQDMLKTPIRIAFDFVNANVIDPVNSILGKFPGGLSIPSLPHLAGGGRVRGPGSGTSDSVLAMLSNDEFVVKASAATQHRDLLDAINADQLPHFADGTKPRHQNIFQRAGSGLSSAVRAVGHGIGSAASSIGNFTEDMITKGARIAAEYILKPLQSMADRLLPADIIPVNMVRGGIDKMFAAVLGKGDEQDRTQAAAAAGAPGGGVEHWRALVVAALAMNGLGAEYSNGVLSLINSESGGNPNAINLIDSNAVAGHPSRGLMQTIPSTFEAYRSMLLPDNIVDPMANVFAGIHYALTNYGGGMLMAGGRHSLGGGYLGYDTGGVMPHGGRGQNMSGRPERVLSPEQTASFDRLVTVMEHGGGGSPVIENVHIRETIDADLVMQRLEFLSRQGRLR